MRIELVTFQSSHARLWLANQQIYRAGWQRGGCLNPWNRAYAWMNDQMCRRGIPTGRRPPIWAWPKARAFGGPPTYETADALLSEAEREAGIWTMELSVPSCFCLRSCYKLRNDVLDEFIDGSSTCTVPPQLFERPAYRHPMPMEPDDTQYCLPFIDRKWIRRVRPLPRLSDSANWDRVV